MDAMSLRPDPHGIGLAFAVREEDGFRLERPTNQDVSELEHLSLVLKVHGGEESWVGEGEVDCLGSELREGVMVLRGKMIP